MFTHPGFDPIAFSIGPLAVRWYGLMYLFGFAAGWGLALVQARKAGSGWTRAMVDDLLFWGAMGVVLGGRVGYVIFYKFSQFLSDPLMLFRIWEGGMSFHGGMLGVIILTTWWGRKRQKTFFEMMDFVAPVVTIGLGAGRLGNFINGELWGRVTDLPWGVVFPAAGALPRHPSQLYEFALEGVLLFAILWWYRSKPRPRPAVSALFVLFYGLFRFLIEFAREPDAHLGYIAFGWLTMGQLLSLPMIAVGVFFFWWAHTYNQKSLSGRQA
jgi:phosphatidylglycerol:prolipoprotein diacylglycerol transferase